MADILQMFWNLFDGPRLKSSNKFVALYFKYNIILIDLIYCKLKLKTLAYNI